MAARYKTSRQAKLQLSPERNRVWTEPSRAKFVKKVPVIYYLSRNGHLDHPHFIEVSLSSDLDLHLKDVIDRLDALRGKGMATLYSWSSKRGYKNGFVWQDLSEEDYIHPAQGNEYILKGSEILNLSSPSYSTASSSEQDLEINDKCDAFGFSEYRVCKSNANTNANASTQTEDIGVSERRDEIEISPPKSTSTAGSEEQERAVEIGSSGRFKASAVLMQLVSCVHVTGKEEDGFAALGDDEKATRGSLEDKEYFSGSVIEVKKKASDEVAIVKRSNSYNADKSRNWKQEINSAKQIEVVRARAKCIPRKNKGNGKNNQKQKVRD